MNFKKRITSLELSKPDDRGPLIIFRTLVAPGKSGPVSLGYYSAYTPNGTIYRQEDETDPAFEDRARVKASEEKALNA